MKIILFLVIAVLIFCGFYFQGWLLTDFRKKIGNLKFFFVAMGYIFLILIIVYLLSK